MSVGDLCWLFGCHTLALATTARWLLLLNHLLSHLKVLK
jgi:hypothetical protein